MLPISIHGAPRALFLPPLHSVAYLRFRYAIIAELIPLSAHEMKVLKRLQEGLPRMGLESNLLAHVTSEDKAAILLEFLKEDSALAHLLNSKVRQVLQSLTKLAERPVASDLVSVTGAGDSGQGNSFMSWATPVSVIDLAVMLRVPEPVAQQLILQVPSFSSPVYGRIDALFPYLDYKFPLLFKLIESASPLVRLFEPQVVQGLLTLFVTASSREKLAVLSSFPKVWPMLQEQSRKEIIERLPVFIAQESDPVVVAPLKTMVAQLSKISYHPIDVLSVEWKVFQTEVKDTWSPTLEFDFPIPVTPIEKNLLEHFFQPPKSISDQTNIEMPIKLLQDEGVFVPLLAKFLEELPTLLPEKMVGLLDVLYTHLSILPEPIKGVMTSPKIVTLIQTYAVERPEPIFREWKVFIETQQYKTYEADTFFRSQIQPEISAEMPSHTAMVPVEILVKKVMTALLGMEALSEKKDQHMVIEIGPKQDVLSDTVMTLYSILPQAERETVFQVLRQRFPQFESILKAPLLEQASLKEVPLVVLPEKLVQVIRDHFEIDLKSPAMTSQAVEIVVAQVLSQVVQVSSIQQLRVDDVLKTVPPMIVKMPDLSLSLSEKSTILLASLDLLGPDFEALQVATLETLVEVFSHVDVGMQLEILTQFEAVFLQLPAQSQQVFLAPPFLQTLVESFESGNPVFSELALSIIALVEMTFVQNILNRSDHLTESRWKSPELSDHLLRWINAHPSFSKATIQEKDEITFLDHVFRIQRIRDEIHHTETVYHKIVLLPPSAYMLHHWFCAQGIQVVKLQATYSESGFVALFQMLFGFGFFDIVMITDSSILWPERFQLISEAVSEVHSEHIVILDSRSFGVGVRLFASQVMQQFSKKGISHLLDVPIPKLFMIFETVERVAHQDWFQHLLGGQVVGDHDRAIVGFHNSTYTLNTEDSLAHDLQAVYRQMTLLEGSPKSIRLLTTHKSLLIDAFVSQLQRSFPTAKVTQLYDPHYWVEAFGHTISICTI